MFDLIKVVNSAGEILFMWLRNGAALAENIRFKDVEQAGNWFAQNYAMTYTGPERRHGFDRRDGYERRKRVTEFERRQRPQGRRWTDEVSRFL